MTRAELTLLLATRLERMAMDRWAADPTGPDQDPVVLMTARRYPHALAELVVTVLDPAGHDGGGAAADGLLVELHGIAAEAARQHEATSDG